MTLVTLKEAENTLATLIKQVAHGEEVVITDTDGRAFKIVPVPQAQKVPQFGIAKDKLWMAEDFDAPLPEFEEYGP